MLSQLNQVFVIVIFMSNLLKLDHENRNESLGHKLLGPWFCFPSDLYVLGVGAICFKAHRKCISGLTSQINMFMMIMETIF